MIESLEINFGYPGNSFAYQGTGWSIRETHGAWMLDDESTLIIPRPQQPGDYLVEMDLGSLLVPGRAFQRLSVRVNGVGVCNQVLRGDLVVQFWVPWSVVGGPLKSMIILSHPDGWSPLEAGNEDTRVLSLYARSLKMSLLTERTWEAGHLQLEDETQLEAIIAQQQNQDGLTLNKLVLDFESLGPNCEFGMVQRHYGAEPLGLFRFSYTPFDGLLAALEDNFLFTTSGEWVSLILDPETREYQLVDGVHDFVWHTWRHEGKADAGLLERQEQARLPYLVRRFRETLEDGEKIFVLRDDEKLTDLARIGLLLTALRRHGDITLLWVSVVTEGHAVGDVEWAGDYLIRGWIDRLTTQREAVNASMTAWGVICQRAHQLWVTRKVSKTTELPV